MEQSQRNSPGLHLVFESAPTGFEPEVVIFSGVDGTIEAGPLAEGYHRAALTTFPEKTIIWNGLVELTKNDSGTTGFKLCVTPFADAATSDVIAWPELPPALSVFDGSHDFLGPDEITAVIADLMTFPALVKGTLHETSRASSIPLELPVQESLADISEIYLSYLAPREEGIAAEAVLLELELFEITYFTLALVSQSDKEGVILALTQHWYRAGKRAGRRVKIPDVEIPQGVVDEVSDFGLRLRMEAPSPPKLGDTLKLQLLEGYEPLIFSVIYARKLSAGYSVGLRLEAFRPEDRKHWQRFILAFQYPSLSQRTQEEHQSTWRLLQEAGYLDLDVGELLNHSQPSILREWEYIDSNGPDAGSAVVGRDDIGVVATIGVTRASREVWVAQTAAVLDDPKYLHFTRAMYGWRTRSILQQPDGNFHLAFFLKNKKFLDRFFRKFLLSLDETEKAGITWDEWKYYGLFFSDKSTSSGFTQRENREVGHGPESREPSGMRLFELLSREPSGPVMASLENQVGRIFGRPHIHVAQYLNSIWANDPALLPQELGPELRFGHPFIAFMVSGKVEKSDLERKYGNLGEIVEGDEDVVWTCKRDLLPRFLANSLKALEQMCRKYGTKKVA